MPEFSSLIAVVDDEETVRKALGRLLGAAGFEVQTFAGGADFLRSAAQRRPHGVVLDLRMPEMNGFEVMQALMQAQMSPPLPVVIISADDSADCRARALRQGARAVLRKPVDEAMLLDAIRQALRPASPSTV
jgi:FixJ family two-component response regulator